jgi:membrane-bound lytic murein transglycosylase D
MAMIPTYVSADLNINYNDGYSAGIWGLTTPVARRYGLIVNNDIDQRYDLKLSSEVAARYLKDLIAHYGNEKVATLAYLNGAALMIEAGKIYGIDLKNISDEELEILYQYLPKNSICDSIKISNISNLDSLYNHIGYTKYKTNHPIRKQIIIDSLFHNSEDFYIHNLSILPNTNWIDEVFVPENENIDEWFATIYESEIEVLKQEQAEIDKQKEAKTQARIAAIKKANAVKIYHVKSGDTLDHIAKRQKVSVRQLKQWNNLKSDMIRVGQKLKIHTN